MNIAEALAASSTSIVTVGPLAFRVRRITSADLLDAGLVSLLVAKPADESSPASFDPKAAAQSARFMDAVVCAGLEAASQDGGTTWEPFRATLEPKRENVSAGVLFVGNLIPGAAGKMASEILKLSTDGGAAGERVASFLGG